ncbi:MAG: hypothetical protein COT74_03820 [Bdellovibrionales bacterium CG10_big_fil_rev_8_21_14_0_10_45_34]|nr:MAG: hypothetical protein COT74_03820 [Bdellovibrionales bacterium CG10_big_fil_rev_8_21_14_0_10_45_34]
MEIRHLTRNELEKEKKSGRSIGELLSSIEDGLITQKLYLVAVTVNEQKIFDLEEDSFRALSLEGVYSLEITVQTLSEIIKDTSSSGIHMCEEIGRDIEVVAKQIQTKGLNEQSAQTVSRISNALKDLFDLCDHLASAAEPLKVHWNSEEPGGFGFFSQTVNRMVDELEGGEFVLLCDTLSYDLLEGILALKYSLEEVNHDARGEVGRRV